MDGLQAIKYERGKLEVLDQLRLPHEFIYDRVQTCEEAFDCIKSMRVRGLYLGTLLNPIAKSWLGAPAIAMVAALALVRVSGPFRSVYEHSSDL